MVRIAEEPEGDPTECLNLDDYNSDDFDEYLSDSMELLLLQSLKLKLLTRRIYLLLPPPPAVTVTIQLYEQHPAEV